MRLVEKQTEREVEFGTETAGKGKARQEQREGSACGTWYKQKDDQTRFRLGWLAQHPVGRKSQDFLFSFQTETFTRPIPIQASRAYRSHVCMHA